MDKKQTSFFSGVKWTTISAIICAVCKFGQIVILSRYLTKAEFGLIGVALMCINISALFTDLGIASGVMHIQNITKKEYSSLFWLNMMSGIIVFIVFWAITPIIAVYYKESHLNDILPIIFSVILITSIYRLQRTIQLKHMNFKFISMADISASIFMLTVSVVLAVLGYGVYSLVLGTICYYLWQTVVFLINSFKYERNISLHFSFKETKPFLKIGMYQLGGSIIDTLSGEMDTLIIGRMFSMETLGVYTLCKQFAVRIYQFINPIITNVLTPVLSKVQEELQEVKNKYLKTITVVAIVNIPIYIFISYFSPEILGIIYGAQYKDGFVVMIILCLINSLYSTGNPIGSLLMALGRTDLGFYWTIYRVVSYTIALYLGALSGRIEICVLSIFLINILNMYPSYRILIHRMIPMKFSEQLSIYVLPLSVCTILCFVNLFHLLGLADIVKVLLAGMVFFPAYYIIVYKRSSLAREIAGKAIEKLIPLK